MAQISSIDIVGRIVSGDVGARDGILGLLDRDSGRFLMDEGQLLDYKRSMDVRQSSAVAELARDILGFSNTDGGLLVLGVSDDKAIVGHEKVDFRSVRDVLGLFIGTRVNFDLEECLVNVFGKTHRLIVIVIHRSSGAYPNQLRRDIEVRPGLVKKLKYVSGTLFFRRNNETLAESPYGDIESKARELGFSGAAPRTRTSFLLQEDKPGLRLYAPINDRFFGREAEIADLIAKFDDPRGRGVSIAGFGGVGKTELAIRLVSELHRRGKFRTVYSASAKQTLLGPGGSQQIDPVFIDLPTFLADLAGWLGFNPPKMAVTELASACLSELAKAGRVVLLVDNLETVADRELVSFLDNQLPSNCWIVATSRVHKVRNFLYPKELRDMAEEDAARLLRHELKRQGLDPLAATEISQLREKAKQLYCHPLAIRWFAWACRKDARIWEVGVGKVDVRELEDFCVAHTLGILDPQTQRVLGAILAIEGVSDASAECIQHTSGVAESVVELALWELECSGLVFAATDEGGITVFSVAPLAERPASDIARIKGWESEYVQNLRSYLKSHRDEFPDSPLVRDLLKLEPRKVQYYSRDEKNELITRIDRAMARCPEKFKLKLKWLKAECHRHLDLPVSADDLYRECADASLSLGPIQNADADRIRILLEAATVAKVRGQTEPQIRRAISYLEAIRHTDFAPVRVLGTLTEMYAIIGERTSYEKYRQLAHDFVESHTTINDLHLDALEEALERARGHFERRYGVASR